LLILAVLVEVEYSELNVALISKNVSLPSILVQTWF